MSNRERLPNRRFCEGISFECGGITYTGHVGRYPNGEIGEVFISGNKAGTHADIAAKDASICFSLARQYGADIETLRKALIRKEDGSASGPLGALLDIVAKDG